MEYYSITEIDLIRAENIQINSHRVNERLTEPKVLSIEW